MIHSLTVNAQNKTIEINTSDTKTDTIISTPSSKSLEIDAIATD